MNALTRCVFALSVAAALAGPAAIAVATPSSASDGQISINTGAGWTQNPSAPLFDATGIVPGWTSSAVLGVRSDASSTTALVLSTTDIVDDENGCTRDESQVDTTCTGTDAGELGHSIVLAVYADPAGDGAFASTPTWTGTIDALAQGTTLAPALAPGATNNYKITAELPLSAGNATQSDRIAFDVLVRLNGLPGGVAVEGTKFTRHGSSPLGAIAGHLPFTGPLAMRFAAAGLSLLLLGCALVLLAAQRRRTRQA